jgi:hypothetical protein
LRPPNKQPDHFGLAVFLLEMTKGMEREKIIKEVKSEKAYTSIQ